MIITVVIGLVMVVSFVGMIICAKKQDIKPMAKPGAIGLLVVVVACAITILSRTMGGGGGEAILQNELKYAKSMTFVLGQELAKVMPGAKTLVIVRENDRFADERYEETLRNGLKEGLASGIPDIKFDTPIVKSLQNLTPEQRFSMDEAYEELVRAKEINSLIAKNKDRKLIIFMIGFPPDERDLQIWQDFNNDPIRCPKVSVLCPDIKKYAPFVAAGLMPVVVIHKPNADYDSPSSGTLRECFDRRYIIVTKDNIKSVAENYPDLFINRK